MLGLGLGAVLGLGLAAVLGLGLAAVSGKELQSHFATDSVSLCSGQILTFAHFLFTFQLIDEIDLRKCYLDVDKKFIGERGIILNLDSWRKLVKAVAYIDRRIKVVELQIKSSRRQRKSH